MKKLLKYGLVGMMATSLVACGSKTPETVVDETAGKTAINFWHLIKVS